MPGIAGVFLSTYHPHPNDTQIDPIRMQSAEGKDAPEVSSPRGRQSRAAAWWIGCGLFLLVLGAYVLSSPGRIDMVDGQIRFDVSYHLVTKGWPNFGDRWLSRSIGVPGARGLRYSFYGPSGSVLGVPLVWLGQRMDPTSVQASEFMFSMLSPILGAAIAPLLFAFYLELGSSLGIALFWTLVSSLGTYVWAISTSSFDNAQHAFFVLAAVYLGYLSQRRKRPLLALLGGTMGAILVLYQEYFVLVVPALALSAIDWKAVPGPILVAQPGERWTQRLVTFLRDKEFRLRAMLRKAWQQAGLERASCVRYALFLLGLAMGCAATFSYNFLRFGVLFFNGREHQPNPHPMIGDFLSGFLTLTISQGKGVIFYSPVIVLGFIGIRPLWRRLPAIAATVIATTAILLGFVSCVAFPGGDWCWGPRYLTVLLPLWALAFPEMPRFRLKRALVAVLLLLGAVSNGLGLAVEHQRFFFELGLEDYFWAWEPWFYMRHSALLAHINEVLAFRHGLPPEATRFNSLRLPNWTTHCLLGPPPNFPREHAGEWIRNYQIYFLPRPWPLWMSRVSPSILPINPRVWFAWTLAVALLGLSLIALGLMMRSGGFAWRKVETLPLVGEEENSR